MRAAACTVIGVYLVAWLATAELGANAVKRDITQRLTPPMLGGVHDETMHVEFGATRAPCPLVVACDSAWKGEITAGAGGRTYAFVLPGVCWHFGYEPYWFA